MSTPTKEHAQPTALREAAERLVRTMTEWLADEPKTRFEVVDDAYRSLRDVLAGNPLNKSGGDFVTIPRDLARRMVEGVRRAVESGRLDARSMAADATLLMESALKNETPRIRKFPQCSKTGDWRHCGDGACFTGCQRPLPKTTREGS